MSMAEPMPCPATSPKQTAMPIGEFHNVEQIARDE